MAPRGTTHRTRHRKRPLVVLVVGLLLGQQPSLAFVRLHYRRPQRWLTPRAAAEPSLAHLLQLLDAKSIRYPPTANRLDLERLLRQNQSTDEALGSNNRSPPSAVSSISKLLAELDARNIRYPPTASRRELEALLQESLMQETTVGDPENVDQSPMEQPRLHTVEGQAPPIEQPLSSLSIRDLLRHLDELDIRYPPTATRSDLEDLLQQALTGPTATRPDARAPTRRQPDPVASAHRRRRDERRRLSEPVDRSPWSSVAWPQAAVDSAVGRVTQQARRWKRRASDYLSTDDDGVRDVGYEYVRREPVPQRRRRPPPTALDHRDDVPFRARQRPPPRQPRRRTASTYPPPSPPPRDDSQVDRRRPLLYLPPASDYNVTAPSDRRPGPFEPEFNEPRRRIYSPYARDDWSGDRFDRFGSFMADVADRFMWGPYDGDDDTTDRPAAAPSNQTAGGHAGERPTSGRKHWKDRLEERFDYLLGIHQDGDYYKSWTTRTAREKQNEGGFDAFSVARGQQPKRRGMAGERQVYDKPIWEEEGNLISLLFGRTPSGNSLLFERLLDPNNGTLLNIFRAVFKSVLLVGSYLCRWASVRGALPQPAVVVGVSAAGMSARAGQRLKAMAIALILFRTAGELLHGYVYGNDGWEDDMEYYDDEDNEYEPPTGDEPATGHPM